MNFLAALQTPDPCPLGPFMTILKKILIGHDRCLDTLHCQCALSCFVYTEFRKWKYFLHAVPRESIACSGKHRNRKWNVIGSKCPATQQINVFSADSVPIFFDGSSIGELTHLNECAAIS